MAATYGRIRRCGADRRTDNKPFLEPHPTRALKQVINTARGIRVLTRIARSDLNVDGWVIEYTNNIYQQLKFWPFFQIYSA